MWNVLPSASMTRTRDRLRALSDACSTTFAATSAVRISGGERTTRFAAIGVSGDQPFGARLHAIVFHACWFATSSTTDAPNAEIVWLDFGVAAGRVVGR